MRRNLARHALLLSIAAACAAAGAAPEAAEAPVAPPAGRASIEAKRAELRYLAARMARVEAEIALEELVRNTLPGDLERLRGACIVAEDEHKRSGERLVWARRMSRLGYISDQQLERDELSYIDKTWELEKTRAERDLLTLKIDPKMRKPLMERLEEAKDGEQKEKAAFDKLAGSGD